MELSITSIADFKVIKPVGRIDWENARVLDKEISAVIDDGFSQIVFNLEEVSFICSGGIGALVYNLNKVKKMGGGIYIISNSEYINFLFETLKFDIIFEGFLFKTFEQFSEKILDKIPS
ncbi:STAS domain-containing protein [Chitinispirillales bacterium ANBcel5]|uniref:STAS domain-containing protein n=1 Tax=Cellulosispirillum alkaliphilum TaxID=3039283 RepID=UPI002A514A3C|nr:STAS domain-containing protein [Chitinispirillales bacterium ANBcel5]